MPDSDQNAFLSKYKSYSEVSPRIAEQVERLPPELKKLLETEYALGNEIYSMELGRGPDKGKVCIILNHPFRSKPADAPAGVFYREFLDRDPRVYEFYVANEMFSLITAKFKPMVLEKLPPGPVSPNEAHAAFMEKRQKEEEEKARQRAAAMAAENERMPSQRSAQPSPARPSVRERADDPPLPIHSFGEAAKRFIASMTMTFDMWHDGLGYDLSALKELTRSERDSIESILIHHQPPDWRDIEALAQLDTPRAKKAVEEALKSRNPQIRQEAMKYVPVEQVDPKERERLLIQSLKNDQIYTGLTQAIDEVPEFHPPAVIDALFHGALNRDGEAAVHFAALLFFLHGKAKEPFDWEHRPFFLRFHTSDRAERRAVFKELCETVGVDPKKYMR